ncbi:tetraspanin Tsp2 family [Heliocybe sulcata]|uniref:Tetraspanin Tsp2 family n=1 Tax=Heliocybe sulcata TaxID=5364 RepID=A0A5C3NEI4_9AGAM|nr:tetraspanin Tsp2 family [Heliocybe sulcata]
MNNTSTQSLTPKLDSPSLTSRGSGANLGVNYIPSKFSELSSIKKRKGKGGEAHVPKRGGGRDAFRANEARMPGAGDEDYDGVSSGLSGQKMRWNKFKWALFFGNSLLSIYSLVALIFCLLTWFNVWARADIVRVGDRTELILSTMAASLGIVTSLIGWAGILLNNRSFLATYTFLLWICFALLVTPGYISYKRRTFNLEGKTNSQWSRNLGADGRLRIQNQLNCCGYFSPFIEATVSQSCYARSILPGCKGAYISFQRKVLERWYTVAFALVPLHIAIMVIGLLCSNHVTYRFGKGMMPKAYRLNLDTMAVIMDQYANQLAEQYGADVASDIISRSRSNLQLDTMPTITYSSGNQPQLSGSKYDQLRNR